MVRDDEHYEQSNAIRREYKSKRKIIYNLEEVIGMLARIEDSGDHSIKEVMIDVEGKRMSIAYIELSEGEIVIAC